MQRFISRLLPFIFIGIALVAFAFGIMLLAYLFLIGATVGFVLFVINAIREKLTQQKTPIKTPRKEGRVIDSDDYRKM